MDKDKIYLSDFRKEEPLEPNISGSSHINISWGERIGSIAGGLVIGYFGLQKFSLKNIVLSLSGGYLIYRGLSGHCMFNELVGIDTSEREGSPVILKKAITINKPRAEVYARWRELEKLPSILKHLSEIRAVDADKKRYHWKMKLPKGLGHLEWDAEIVDERPNELIAFRTYNGSDVSQSGRVEFIEAPGGRGTEMHATIKYYPPAGYIGSAAAKALNGYIATLVLEDMKRFKKLLETGEITKIDGQPSGRDEDY